MCCLGNYISHVLYTYLELNETLSILIKCTVYIQQDNFVKMVFITDYVLLWVVGSARSNLSIPAGTEGCNTEQYAEPCQRNVHSDQTQLCGKSSTLAICGMSFVKIIAEKY